MVPWLRPHFLDLLPLSHLELTHSLHLPFGKQKHDLLLPWQMSQQMVMLLSWKPMHKIIYRHRYGYMVVKMRSDDTLVITVPRFQCLLILSNENCINMKKLSKLTKKMSPIGPINTIIVKPVSKLIPDIPRVMKFRHLER